jgi:hypothetical protein
MGKTKTNSDMQNTTQKTKDKGTLKPGERRCSGRGINVCSTGVVILR